MICRDRLGIGEAVCVCLQPRPDEDSKKNKKRHAETKALQGQHDPDDCLPSFGPGACSRQLLKRPASAIGGDQAQRGSRVSKAARHLTI